MIKAYTTRVGTGPFPTEQDNEIGRKLQTIGKEFGVTTGRKRRCGWLDAVQLRYSKMVNGFTHVAVTKLDILDNFDYLQVGKRYRLKNELIDSFPASCDELAEVEVEYIEIKGWKESTQNVKTYEELPQKAKEYIELIEELIGVKGTITHTLNIMLTCIVFSSVDWCWSVSLFNNNTGLLITCTSDNSCRRRKIHFAVFLLLLLNLSKSILKHDSKNFLPNKRRFAFCI